MLFCSAKRDFLAFEAVTGLEAYLARSHLFSVDIDGNIEELAEIVM